MFEKFLLKYLEPTLTWHGLKSKLRLAGASSMQDNLRSSDLYA